jgi:hypothetical protein
VPNVDHPGKRGELGEDTVYDAYELVGMPKVREKADGS